MREIHQRGSRVKVSRSPGVSIFAHNVHLNSHAPAIPQPPAGQHDAGVQARHGAALHLDARHRHLPLPRRLLWSSVRIFRHRAIFRRADIASRDLRHEGQLAMPKLIRQIQRSFGALAFPSLAREDPAPAAAATSNAAAAMHAADRRRLPLGAAVRDAQIHAAGTKGLQASGILAGLRSAALRAGSALRMGAERLRDPAARGWQQRSMRWLHMPRLSITGEHSRRTRGC